MNEPVNEPVLICAELLNTPSAFSLDFTPFVKCADEVSNDSVRVADISPPPLKPDPAVIKTDV